VSTIGFGVVTTPGGGQQGGVGVDWLKSNTSNRSTMIPLQVKL